MIRERHRILISYSMAENFPFYHTRRRLFEATDEPAPPLLSDEADSGLFSMFVIDDAAVLRLRLRNRSIKGVPLLMNRKKRLLVNEYMHIISTLENLTSLYLVVVVVVHHLLM